MYGQLSTLSRIIGFRKPPTLLGNDGLASLKTDTLNAKSCPERLNSKLKNATGCHSQNPSKRQAEKPKIQHPKLWQEMKGGKPNPRNLKQDGGLRFPNPQALVGWPSSVVCRYVTFSGKVRNTARILCSPVVFSDSLNSWVSFTS